MQKFTIKWLNEVCLPGNPRQSSNTSCNYLSCSKGKSILLKKENEEEEVVVVEEEEEEEKQLSSGPHQRGLWWAGPVM